MVVSALTTADTKRNITEKSYSVLKQNESTRAEEWDRFEKAAQLLRLECIRTIALLHKLKC